MLTLDNYQYPNDTSWEDKPNITITKVLNNLIVDQEIELIIQGSGFDSDTVGVLYPEGNIPDNFFVTPITLISNVECKIKFTPTEVGNYQLILATGTSLSEAVPLKVSSLPTSELPPEEQQKDGILILDNLANLKLGNTVGKMNDYDILYYGNYKPIQKGKGVYTTARSYLVFPQLRWEPAKENKTVSFIFYSSSETRRFVFGMVSELTNLWSNSFSQPELGLYFVNRRGIYYQYGKYSSNRSSFTYKGYESFDYGYYYRFDILNNGRLGSTAELYRLDSGDPKDWLKGKHKQTVTLSGAPDRDGTVFYPWMGEYNGSRNPLMGVIVR